ncbi:MAG TPA: DUF5713 family protein [Xanthomonadales bacterium]|nr:DUF5713 family protein [Xanthomonadales bacterium]
MSALRRSFAATGLLLSFAASAHVDRGVKIADDGTLVGIPAEWGPVTLVAPRSADGDVERVRLASPAFDVELGACVLERLRGVIDVVASSSWYHEAFVPGMPPYVTIDFVQARADAPTDAFAMPVEDVELTFSLVDGRVLAAMQTSDPWWWPRSQERFENAAAECTTSRPATAKPVANADALRSKRKAIANDIVRTTPFLDALYADAAYPRDLVAKGEEILLDLCATIEAQKPADVDALYALTHAATLRFNELGAELTANGSAIDTVAREAIAVDFGRIAMWYGFANADRQALVAPRDW